MPLKLKIANSDTVGVDRILAAAAAFDRTKEAVAVADFGTAITIDCVNDDGEFLGGSILPGLTLSAQALHEKTAALPLITPGRPDGVFGTDTETAIRGGIFYAALGALREIVERYATHLGHWPSLVLTGGDAKLIAPACDFADGIEENLTLEGILLAWRRHVSQRKK